MPTSKPTIGVIAAWLGDRYATAVVAGVVEAVRDRGQVLCFSGGRLGAPDSFEAQGNVLYDLIGPDNVDALVVLSGALVTFVGAPRVEEFCRRYLPLPVVSIALAFDGIPSVLVDTDAGMRRSISHLVMAHGRRRIAFIRGPEFNDEAQRRYRTYRDMLSQHDIALDPRLVAPGDFTGAAGRAAVEMLLDRRKARPDAIVAANDGMAITCLEELARRGVRVPEDIAVVGFDDVEEARYASPPLTTVRQPLHEQGRKAGEAALTLLAGGDVPQRILLPTKHVMRQSCGCAAPIPNIDDGAGAIDEARKRLRAERRAGALSSLSQALIQTLEADEIADVVEKRLPELGVQQCFLSLYETDDQARLLVGYDANGARASRDRFPTRELAPKGALDASKTPSAVIEPLFFREHQIGLATLALDLSDGALYEHVRGQLSAALERAHRSSEMMRLYAAETERARELERAHQVERGRAGLRFVLEATTDLHRIQPLGEMLEGLLNRVGGLLAAVGSTNDPTSEGFVALTEENGSFSIRASSGRFAGIGLKRFGPETVSRVERALERREIQLHPDGSAIPLTAGELAVGAIYLARPTLAERDVEFIQVLANQAAVAIRNAELYELATVDRLTGTCVRAFFEQWMLRELRSAFRAEQPLAFLMVDVDEMKSINDGAGHLAGDQALAVVGRALREATRGSDFVGRYGGDEFGILLPLTGVEGARVVASRILDTLSRERVQKSETEFGPLKTSIGISVLVPGSLRASAARKALSTTYFADHAKALIQAADEGLDRAKREGGACIGEGNLVAWSR